LKRKGKRKKLNRRNKEEDEATKNEKRNYKMLEELKIEIENINEKLKSH